jgi:multiple sugar transport system substrate-binding protein
MKGVQWTMKRHFKWAAVVGMAALLLLSACSAGGSKPAARGTSQGGDAGGSKSDKAAQLRIMWWGPDARHKATLQVLDMYTKMNPQISFAPEYTDWNGFWTKMTTLAASKSIPDVLQMDGAYIQDYAKRGLLEDLSDVDLEGVVDAKIIDNSKMNGKLYGIPLSHNGSGIVFNKTDLEAAGVKLPVKNWSWDDYFAFANEVRAKMPKEKYGITDGSNVWDWYQFYQTSYGKGPMMMDGSKFNLDKELWFKFQQTYEQFRKDGVVPPAQVQAAFKENDPKGDSMASGTVLSRPATVASVSVLETLLPGKVAVVNNPIGPSGGGWAQSTIYLSISKNSKHINESKKFAKWFITDKEAGKALGTTRGIPINADIFKEVQPSLSKADMLGKEMLDVAVDKALPFYPAPPGWEDFVKTYSSDMEAVMFGKETLQHAYDKIVAKGKETEAKLSKK